jgi:acetylornithine deacetylase
MIAFPLDAQQLTDALVAVDSRNPSLVADGPGEKACATLLHDVLAGWGFAVSMDEIAPNRCNVVARIGPAGRTPLLLNGHLDVVGVEGMEHPPFEAHRADGNLYARGSTDMKAGIASMCVAAARAAARGALASEIIIAAVCDEEFASIGTRALLERGLRATGAVITEPTRLAVCPSHKGFAWIEVRVMGRAAHGSRYDTGIDANRHAAAIIVALDMFEREVLTTRQHPLLGRPSLHVAMLHGGSGWSTYADRCVVRVERRTIPGETDTQVMDEVRAVCESVRSRHPDLHVELTLVCAQPPLDLPVDAPLVQAMQRAARDASLRAPIDGLSCWTDAALFQAAGIPALCFGPGDIARAHAAREWVEEQAIDDAVAALDALCSSWGRA